MTSTPELPLWSEPDGLVKADLGFVGMIGQPHHLAFSCLATHVWGILAQICVQVIRGYLDHCNSPSWGKVVMRKPKGCCGFNLTQNILVFVGWGQKGAWWGLFLVSPRSILSVSDHLWFTSLRVDHTEYSYCFRHSWTFWKCLGHKGTSRPCLGWIYFPRTAQNISQSLAESYMALQQTDQSPSSCGLHKLAFSSPALSLVATLPWPPSTHLLSLLTPHWHFGPHSIMLFCLSGKALPHRSCQSKSTPPSEPDSKPLLPWREMLTSPGIALWLYLETLPSLHFYSHPLIAGCDNYSTEHSSLIWASSTWVSKELCILQCWVSHSSTWNECIPAFLSF